jgi:hypothetical protein
VNAEGTYIFDDDDDLEDEDTEDERVIHAMILRPKFYQYLR